MKQILPEHYFKQLYDKGGVYYTEVNNVEYKVLVRIIGTEGNLYDSQERFISDVYLVISGTKHGYWITHQYSLGEVLRKLSSGVSLSILRTEGSVYWTSSESTRRKAYDKEKDCLVNFYRRQLLREHFITRQLTSIDRSLRIVKKHLSLND